MEKAEGSEFEILLLFVHYFSFLFFSAAERKLQELKNTKDAASEQREENVTLLEAKLKASEKVMVFLTLFFSSIVTISIKIKYICKACHRLNFILLCYFALKKFITAKNGSFFASNLNSPKIAYEFLGDSNTTEEKRGLGLYSKLFVHPVRCGASDPSARPAYPRTPRRSVPKVQKPWGEPRGRPYIDISAPQAPTRVLLPWCSGVYRTAAAYPKFSLKFVNNGKNSVMIKKFHAALRRVSIILKHYIFHVAGQKSFANPISNCVNFFYPVQFQ